MQHAVVTLMTSSCCSWVKLCSEDETVKRADTSEDVSYSFTGRQELQLALNVLHVPTGGKRSDVS